MCLKDLLLKAYFDEVILDFQTAKAAAVSDECVANIRTVRAFAMEGSASELYEKEIDESGKLHEWLGLGIGVFQGKKLKIK